MPIDGVLRVLYRESRQHTRYSAEWYGVHARISTAVRIWRMDNTLRVVK